MNVQHTPGEWKVSRGLLGRDHGGLDVQRSNGQAVARIVKDSWMTEGEREANARLIAAAPEMLAALIAVFPRLGADANREVSDMVKAAIARATT